MKRTYKKPKAILVDFHYDQQVTASSSGGSSEDRFDMYGFASVQRCQYGASACTSIFNPTNASVCDVLLPWSRK